MDDFTFPTTAAAAEPADPLCLHHHYRRRLPSPHFAASPLWFPSSPTANAAAAVAVAPVVLSRRSVEDMEEQEPTSDGAAERPAEGEGEGELVPGAADEDRMDMLWENFNEELEALRRAGSCSKESAGGGAASGGVELSSDTDSEPAGRGHGFAPMLRPSSRAGGTGHYRRTSWMLLMRIFRRFFVIEKTMARAQ